MQQVPDQAEPAGTNLAEIAEQPEREQRSEREESVTGDALQPSVEPPSGGAEAIVPSMSAGDVAVVPGKTATEAVPVLAGEQTVA